LIYLKNIVRILRLSEWGSRYEVICLSYKLKEIEDDKLLLVGNNGQKIVDKICPVCKNYLVLTKDYGNKIMSKNSNKNQPVVDHILSQSSFYSYKLVEQLDNIENLRVICRSCNSKRVGKNKKQIIYWNKLNRIRSILLDFDKFKNEERFKYGEFKEFFKQEFFNLFKEEGRNIILLAIALKHNRLKTNKDDINELKSMCEYINFDFELIKKLQILLQHPNKELRKDYDLLSYYVSGMKPLQIESMMKGRMSLPTIYKRLEKYRIKGVID